LLASVSSVALIPAAGSLNAADIARPVYKAPPVVPPPVVFSWTGCFVGAHVGWGWGRKDVTSGKVNSAGLNTSGPFGSDRIDVSGGLLGGQVGCDFQFGWGKAPGTPGNWVIGIQGDFAGADINGFGPDPADPTDHSLRVKVDSIASVTGRLGFTGFGKSPFMSQTLWYVRGGVAWLHERWDLTDAKFQWVFETHDTKASRSGWTVGAGVEWAFAPNWSAFVEWDHYDFGNKTVIIAPFPYGDDFAKIDAKERIETVKIGINYRFNFGKTPAPVVARY
jgi:outer membrane immunogenic protein